MAEDLSKEIISLAKQLEENENANKSYVCIVLVPSFVDNVCSCNNPCYGYDTTTNSYYNGTCAKEITYKDLTNWEYHLIKSSSSSSSHQNHNNNNNNNDLVLKYASYLEALQEAQMDGYTIIEPDIQELLRGLVRNGKSIVVLSKMVQPRGGDDDINRTSKPINNLSSSSSSMFLTLYTKPPHHREKQKNKDYVVILLLIHMNVFFIYGRDTTDNSIHANLCDAESYIKGPELNYRTREQSIELLLSKFKILHQQQLLVIAVYSRSSQ